ncbi:MAG: hypothetical protein GY811_25510 [Myxococcales bacterium]|nr:hypothetical protein [Myxococcales bacterium]
MASSGKVRVLVVDENQNRGQMFQRCLSDEFEISLAESREVAQIILDSEEFDVLVGANDLVNGRTQESGSPDQSATADGSNGSHIRGVTSFLGPLVGGKSSPEQAKPDSKRVLAEMVEDVISSGRSLDVAMAAIETAVIRTALKEQRGNRSAVARQLQLPRQTLQDRMKKHGLWSS